MNQLYSADKILQFPDRIAQFKRGELVNPCQLLISICDLCNHDCPWCSFRDSALPTSELFAADGKRNPNRMLTWEKIEETIISALRLGIDAIQFTGGGEPTLHPQFAQAIDLAFRLLGRVGLITNGERPIADTTLHQLTWLRCSLDAATPKTFEKIHGRSPAAFEKVISNLRSLAEQREATEIGISFVIQRDNWREIPAAIDLARTLQVDNIRFAPLLSAEGESYYDGIADSIDESLRVSSTTGLKIFSTFAGRALAYQEPASSTCHYQQLAPFLGADQNLYRCCKTAYTSAGLLGSIRQSRLDTLWRSEDLQSKIKTFDARDCQLCIFQEKNRTISELVSLNDPHGSFV
jgi:Fe-coproporphyrin III synthase